MGRSCPHCRGWPPVVRGWSSAFSISDDTEQADLRGGRSPWFATSSHPPRRDLRENLTCDALIVGAGITGSLVAERLTRQGLDVIIVDRELPGRGSTAASTSMLLWEIDRLAARAERNLRFRARSARLSRQPGCRRRPQIAGLAARHRLRHARQAFAVSGGGRKQHRSDGRASLRGRAGLPGDFLDHATLLDAFGITRAGAIVSPGAADADPLQLAHGLLRTALASGARLFEADAVTFDAAGRSVNVGLANDREIEARSVDSRHRLRHARHRSLHRARGVVELGDRDHAAAAKRLERRHADLGRREGLSLRANDAGRTHHHRRRGQQRDRRTGGARSPDPGEIARAGAKARGAVACRRTPISNSAGPAPSIRRPTACR